MNKGAKKLSAILQARGRGGQVQVRNEVGVAQGVVGRWASGERLPAGAQRGILFGLYGIDPRLWDT